MYAMPKMTISIIRNSEVTGEELKAEKKEIKTTNANARSIPVVKFRPDDVLFSIVSIIALRFQSQIPIKSYSAMTFE